MVVHKATAKVFRPLLPDQREKKVEILCRTQKEIPREFVVSALNATDYDVVAGFDLLELLFGDTDDSAEGQSDTRNNIETEETQVHTIFITLRIFFPEVSFEFVQGKFDEYGSLGHHNVGKLIARHLLGKLPVSDDQGLEESVPENPIETIECQCCFGEGFLIDDTTCCSNTDSPHRFCMDCASSTVKAELENGRSAMRCADISGCEGTFTETEIQRFLDQKTYEWFDRVRTRNEIRKAALPNMVYCPFCDYGAIMDDPKDLIFECPECTADSCRYCHVLDHSPKSCEEYQLENTLTSRHAVEEAMSAALIRRCNVCGQPFVKDGGCNQMTCSCGNSQCFVCSQNVDGHDHFEESNGECPLFDNSEDRQRRDVATAQENTVRQRLELDTLLTEEDLIVDRELNQPLLPPQQFPGPNLRWFIEDELFDLERIFARHMWLRPDRLREDREREQREQEEREAREREREQQEREQRELEAERARIARDQMERDRREPIQPRRQHKEIRQMNRTRQTQELRRQNRMAGRGNSGKGMRMGGR